MGIVTFVPYIIQDGGILTLCDDYNTQMMRVLARNISFLMKSIELGKEKYGLPEKEGHLWTNFIR